MAKNKFTKEIFLQRVRDMMKEYRMHKDVNLTVNEVLRELKAPGTTVSGNNGNGEITSEEIHRYDL